MELAKTVVRSCVRSFYTTREILIVDALAIHSALRDDDLAYLMAMNTKDLRKACAPLVDARFLSTHVRQELKEGQARPINRTYFFIDYRLAIDGIKYRIFKLQQDNQVPTVPAAERKEYKCPYCKAEWTLMEAIDNTSERGLLCHTCQHVLIQNVDGQSEGQQRVTRLNTQLDFLVSLLNEVDDIRIPDNSFEKALAAALPVERDAQHQILESVPVEGDRPTAVKGLVATGPDRLDINIHAGEGKSLEELEAERARQEKLAKQNELPDWMIASTVDGSIHRKNVEVPAVANGYRQDAAKKQSLDAAQDLEMKRMFDDIRKEQEAAEALKRQQQDIEDEEDEEDEFEDVVATPENSAPPRTNGSVAAKVATNPLPPGANGKSTNGAVKPDPDTSLPDRPAKKVKLEEPTPVTEANDGDEDDLVFEDV